MRGTDCHLCSRPTRCARVTGFYHSLWFRTAPAYPLAVVLQGTETADVAVIGGGISGLSAAIHLAEAGIRVAVLEATEIGFGASGRNGGFVVPHFARGDPDALVARQGEHAERLVELVGHSAQALFELIARLEIDCDAHQSGWFQPAHSKRALAMIEQRASQWSRRGQPVTLHDADETERLTGCRDYLGSWRNASGGTIHPLKFVYGLARAASSHGARIFSRSAVIDLRRNGTYWRLATARGEVRAQQVLVCTNGISRSLLPRLADMVVPLNIFQGATQPIDPASRAHLFRQGQSLSDTRLNLFTYRFDAQWRLITGALPMWGVRAAERLGSHMARRLQVMLRLPTVPHMEFVWEGQASLTPDFMPTLVELHTGVIAGTACNGRGLAMSTQLGRVLAEGVRRGSWHDAPIALRGPTPARWRHLTRWALRGYPIYGRVRDHLDQLPMK